MPCQAEEVLKAPGGQPAFQRDERTRSSGKRRLAALRRPPRRQRRRVITDSDDDSDDDSGDDSGSNDGEGAGSSTNNPKHNGCEHNTSTVARSKTSGPAATASRTATGAGTDDTGGALDDARVPGGQATRLLTLSNQIGSGHLR